MTESKFARISVILFLIFRYNSPDMWVQIMKNLQTKYVRNAVTLMKFIMEIIIDVYKRQLSDCPWIIVWSILPT